jgi:putative membrane protein insertion efficiency factor
MIHIKRDTLIITAAVALLLVHGPLQAGDFGPWDSAVKTGARLNHASGKAATHAKALTSVRVFSGIQGGAWLMIRFFQIVISPQDGPSCRFHPTCSAYGRQAVQKHGALLGAFMAGERLIRCNPYSTPGEDPVPDRLYDDK